MQPSFLFDLVKRVKRVLVVSDDRDGAVELLNALTASNVSYYVVTTARACLEIVEDREICAAIIDNSIMDIQGQRLLDLVLQVKPEIEVIFVNGGDDEAVEPQVRQLGVLYYASDLRDRKIVHIVAQLISQNGYFPRTCR